MFVPLLLLFCFSCVFFFLSHSQVSVIYLEVSGLVSATAKTMKALFVFFEDLVRPVVTLWQVVICNTVNVKRLHGPVVIWLYYRN